MKARSNTIRVHVACTSVLAGFALFLFLTSPTNGDFWWFDSSRHAMNGVFVRDLLFEGGLWHPIDFATDYYRQYPAINIGFYPPLFYISSVPFLAVFGASHPVSQVVVTLYALAIGVLTYLICSRQMDRLTSLATALCVMALPAMALWARQVQLDVPAVSLLLATAYSLIRHLEGGDISWLFGTAVCLGLSVLTRVQGVYALPAILYFLLFYRYNLRPAIGLRISALVTAALIALPSILMAMYFSQINQSLAVQMDGMPKLMSYKNWSWYADKLPQQLGWPAFTLTVGGLTTIAVSFKKHGMAQPLKVLTAFLLCSWIFFSIVSNKDPRFNLPSLPFLFILSVSWLYLLTPRLARVAVLTLAVWLVVQATAFSTVPFVGGFKEAVLAAQTITPRNRNVLISAHRDGTFIYNMRTLGERRDIGVRRADKLFVEIKIMRSLGIKDHNLDQRQILDLLGKQNISTIVAQTDYLSDQTSMQNFQKMLDSGLYFRKVQTIEMQGKTGPDQHELVIYKIR